jgi:hypothetical protein
MRKRGLRMRTFRLICVAMASVWVSGCAVINPHETLRRSSDPPPTKIVDGIKYADKAKAAYWQAIKEQSQLRSWLGIGLIPLGAAALGLGVTSGPPAAIAALGLTGAAGYGIGTWLESKPNQKAWLAGYSATTCAVDAILPLLYVEMNQDAINQDIGSLDTAITGLDSTLGAVRALLLEAGEKPPGVIAEMVKLGRERATEGEAVRAAALETRTKAVRMKQEAAGAGASLKEAVDRISAQVSVQLIEATPDLSTLSSIVGGLAQSYGQFVRVPEGRPSGPAEAKAQGRSTNPRIQKVADNLPTAIANLENAIQVARTAIQRVADTVNAVTAGKPIEKLRACGVVDAIVAPMTIEPAGAIELEVGKTMTGARTIRGGAPPYFVEPQGDTVDGLTVRKGDMNTAAFVVQITAKTPAGQYLLLVAEKSGQRVFVTVNVKGGQLGAGAGPGTRPDGAATSNLPRVVEELESSGPTPLSMRNAQVDVILTRAEVVDGRLLISVTVKAKTGPTTTAVISSVSDDDIVAAAVLTKPFKDNGVTKEQVTVHEKKPAR